ncbi:hypothetical protein EYZ11_008893 [Aspergillus tanneri]|uniref:Uncharacterized protein n=1 Tax=Aspergillus tanneri TaxID=1220188 RepID=A0A4S3J9Q7_9EURO|nr:hypothetical protein EYZ11_008893 [Aspergillus tanneri]
MRQASKLQSNKRTQTVTINDQGEIKKDWCQEIAAMRHAKQDDLFPYDEASTVTTRIALSKLNLNDNTMRTESGRPETTYVL